MYAYTFKADLNGAFVVIPEELRNKKKSATFFVVVDDEPMREEVKKDLQFESFIPTKGFKFNREEANER